MALALRASGLSHVGVVRSSNQDSAFIGNRLLVMADGMGGHAGGDIASATAVKRIRELDPDLDRGPADLEATIFEAQDDIVARVAIEPVLAGMGTTITSLILDSDEFTMAHIGDSRAYRLREGKIEQITTDHTFVQHLIDTGRLAPEDAEKHPQRSVLLRVLGDVEGPARLDVSTFPAQAGERWLLCSDGLSGVVDDATLQSTLRDFPDREECAQKLVDLAIAGGGPDNITCIVADVVEIEDGDSHPDQSVVLGSAATTEVSSDSDTPDTAAHPAEHEEETAEVHIASVADVEDAEDLELAGDQYDEAAEPAADEKERGLWARIFRGTLLLFLLLAVVLGALWGGWKWSQSQWFVGDEGGKVAIYRGIPQDIGPWTLYDVYEVSEIKVDELEPYFRTRVDETLPANDVEDARRIVTNIREQITP